MYNEYPKILSNKLKITTDYLSPLWKDISLEKFQKQNFSEEKDINYLKQLFAEILKSNFYQELEKQFIDNEFYERGLFEKENKIEELIENIIFLPFYGSDLGISGLTLDRKSTRLNSSHITSRMPSSA